MQIGLEEKDIAVEGVHLVHLVLQLQRLDLGQDLDQGMAGQHTAMPDIVLPITGRATVMRRRGIITRCLLRTVMVVMIMMIDH